MPHTLSVLRGNALSLQHSLVEDEIVVGRDSKCDIVIDDHTVSRRHARLTLENDDYFIEDLRSRNGTYVNGRRVTGRVRLSSDDHVMVCGTEFLFQSSQLPIGEIDEDLTPSVSISLDDSSGTEILTTANAEERLRAILQINDALAGTLDHHRAMNNMLDRLFDIFPQADCCSVLLRRANRFVSVAAKHRQEKQESSPYSRTIVEKAVKERRAIFIEDVTRDQESFLTDSVRRLRMRSIMCAPLLSQNEEVVGVVHLDTRHKKRKFTLDDAHILSSVARQAAIWVEYVQLHQEKMRHVRLQRELDIARQVQYSLLPEAVPELEGYRFWAYYQAAGPIGGDFYDFLRLPNGSEGVVLGDVAGKGVPAALNMVKVSTLCKVALLRHPDNVARAMNSLNDDMCHTGSEISLASLILCVVNPRSHELTIANAGHMSPIFRRNDGAVDERLGDEVGGYMLGVEPEFPYETGTTRLAPGEFVVLYSDGISDAMNAAGQRYTVEGIRRQLLGIGARSPAEIGEALLDDVRRHAAGTDQHDDMALVVFRREVE